MTSRKERKESYPERKGAVVAPDLGEMVVYVSLDSDLQEENIIQIRHVEQMRSLDEFLQECKR